MKRFSEKQTEYLENIFLTNKIPDTELLAEITSNIDRIYKLEPDIAKKATDKQVRQWFNNKRRKGQKDRKLNVIENESDPQTPTSECTEPIELPGLLPVPVRKLDDLKTKEFFQKILDNNLSISMEYDRVFKNGIEDYDGFINYITANRRRSTCKYKKYSNSVFKDILLYHFNQSRREYQFLTLEDEERLRIQIDDIDDISEYLHRIENNCKEDPMMLNYFREYCFYYNLTLPESDGNLKQQENFEPSSSNSDLEGSEISETSNDSSEKSVCIFYRYEESIKILEQVLTDFSSDLKIDHIEKIANCTELTIDEINEYINKRGVYTGV